MTIKKSNYLPLILIPVIFYLCYGLWWVDKTPVPSAEVDSDTGVYDMRDFDFHSNIVSISRNVEYIPGELLTPEEFELRDDIQVGKVPDGTKIVTMRIRLLMPENIHYGIGGYSTNYASSVFVNGIWMFDMGKPALTLEDEQATEAFHLFSAQPVDGVIEILIQSSGYASVDTSSGMGWFFGEQSNVRVFYTRTIAHDIIVMTCYIALAVISLLLFLVLPDYKATGWLTLLSLVWAVRVGLKSRKILLTLFPVHTWNLVFKTEIITSPLTMLLLTLVLHSVFAGALPKWLRALIIGGSAVMALAVVFLPWQTFLGHSVWSNPIIYWTLIVMLGFILFSVRRSKPTLSQIIILVGMGMVVFSFMWDENYFRQFSEPYLGNLRLPFAITQPTILVFTVFMFVATMFDTMRKTVKREVELVQKIETQERELLETRIAVMLGQIQPHFLYNSLSAISRLCDKDPAQAKKATIAFSTYLRGNMDSLDETEPILFEKELCHVEGFLDLEKAMYEEALNVIYNVKTKGFLLPVLSLQPIVENSVKHGIGKKEGGGSVTISTDETEREYLVVVSDDGMGFDCDKVPDDGQTHIGINNVRKRLYEQCGGLLEIESQKGIGTTVTMRIPKCNVKKGEGI